MSQSIYILYAPADEVAANELRKNLSILRRLHGVQFTDAVQIGAGVDRQATIQAALTSANIVLLLYSHEFASDDDCVNLMEQSLSLSKAGQCTLMPVILRDSLWQQEPFANLGVLPKHGKPILSDGWSDSNAPYTEILKALTDAISPAAPRQEPTPVAVASPSPVMSNTPTPSNTPQAPKSSDLEALLLGAWEFEDVIVGEYSCRKAGEVIDVKNQYLSDNTCINIASGIQNTYRWQVVNNQLICTEATGISYAYQIKRLDNEYFEGFDYVNGMPRIFRQKRLPAGTNIAEQLPKLDENDIWNTFAKLFE